MSQLYYIYIYRNKNWIVLYYIRIIVDGRFQSLTFTQGFFTQVGYPVALLSKISL